MIGILYHLSTLRRLIKGKKSFEKPAFYSKTAREIGEEVLFLSLSDIKWTKETVLGWDGVKRARTEKKIPTVIINRMRTNNSHVRRSIQRLKRLGIIIFNEHNVISKLKVHHIMSRNHELLPHLPATDSVTRQSVEDLLEQNHSLFLKPRTASVGNGIIRIRRKNSRAIVEINVLGQTKRKNVGIGRIVKIVGKKKKKYLVQQGISLMRYKNKPVDFRVSMQKNGEGQWQYTGAVGRIAKKGAIVTNLHCGGLSIKTSELFQNWGWNGPEIEQNLEAIGLRIAKTLEAELPMVADLGLDIALDEHQHPWFIEANFRDLRVTFRDAGEKEKWRATFATPIHYAAYLLKKRGEEQDRTKQTEIT